MTAELVAGWFVATAAEAAARLGVFDALPCSIDELVAKHGDRIHALIDLLVGGGRLVRDRDGLALGAEGPRDTRGAALVVEVIRRDRPFAPGQDPAELHRDASDLDVRKLLAPGAVVRALDAIEALDACPIFLDAGGGLGDATRAFLARSSGRAILVDVAPVIEAARRHLADLEDRITFLVADLRETELPRCDLAFLSNVLHLHPEPACTAIVERVVRSVDRGGIVAINDVATFDDRSGPLSALAFGLACQTFGDGHVRTSTHLANYLKRLGVNEIETVRHFGATSVVARGRIG